MEHESAQSALVFTNFDSLAQHLDGKATAVTIGVFDGLHIGHQALIQKTVEIATAEHLSSLVITFPDHPLAILAPPYCPKKLIYPKRRRQILGKRRIDLIAEIPFTEEFASISPADFIREILIEKCCARAIICGYDFTFGKAGSGNVALLQRIAAEQKATVIPLDPVADKKVNVKSTMIRDLLLNGHVERAAHLLSRPYELCGGVETGYGRGKQIGFPTANIQITDDYVIPARGVYFCAVMIDGKPPAYAAMTNIGFNPTFGNEKLSIEAHILNFDSDLSDKCVSLFFLRRMRDERKFPDVDSLRRQLQSDRLCSQHLAETPEVIRELQSLEAQMTGCPC